jgi:hypothetical protein
MSDFKELVAVDVSKHTAKKGNFTYLAWTFAHEQLAMRDPEYTYVTHDFPASDEGQIRYPYLATPAGCFVRVGVVFKGKTWVETLPILDFKNKPVSANDVNSMDVNTALKRCFVKAAAHHGIGLYIYEGLDAPPERDVSDIPAHKVVLTGGKFEGFELGELASKGGIEGLGHLKWLSTNSSAGEVMNAKALEVYEAHAPTYSDDDVIDLIADAEQPGELSGLYRLLTDEQKVTFKDALAVRKGEITETTQRTAETARG